MKHKKILLSAITAISLINSNLLANETTQLEDVTVWETQVVSSSLNLGEKAIETKQADHLSDLLKDLPGVDVGGTHSINNRINIRGLQDENLEITLDGAKVQNANMFHHIGNLLINPDILKKADIQVGTNSVVNGSLGGSVAFETKDGKDMLEAGKDFGARVSTTYNSNDSIGGSLTGYGKVSQNVDFLIYHNYLNKNDWEDGKGVKTFGSDGEVQNTLIKLGYNLSDTQRVSVSYDTLTDEGDYSPRPDFGRAYNESVTGLYTYPTEYTRETITLKHELNLGDN
jgi:hemoglobin/transferrin/lactoferrin receptor protein